jgi:hypothetical protein
VRANASAPSILAAGDSTVCDWSPGATPRSRGPKNATPVVFSPVSRSSASAQNPGFAGLDQEARDFAASDGVALVDLSTLSRNYYASAPNRSALFIDGTHFHEIGALGVAGVVANALKASTLPLSAFVR